MQRYAAPIFLSLAMLACDDGPQLKSPPSEFQATVEVQAPVKSEVVIVQMAGDPVLGYGGGIRGLPATKPAEGEKLKANSSAVKKYKSYLNNMHDAALSAVGAGAKKVYSYTAAFNGFTAVLTPAEIAGLKAYPGVVNIMADELQQTTTDSSPGFLGLTDEEGGLWTTWELTGEDVIVGVIDTGAWPEHPSFSDQIDLTDRPGASGRRTLVYGAPPAYWNGTCQAGELWSQDDCNNKLVGARYFLDGFGHHGIIFEDYLSARDRDGHGSHTASTAAGNANVPASIMGIDRGVISGMAPRARIAVYKTCWNGEGCYTSDLSAAIDAAVYDGVDVINYSIGGSAQTFMTSDAISFLFAEDAGIFIANSAGNSGPDPDTLGNPTVSPWVTSVGASTQSRIFLGSVALGDGNELFGATVTGGTGILPLVDAAEAGSALCIPGRLGPSVAGKIVLCKRGTNARVEKSLAVAIAGGAGMVLYNTTDDDNLFTDSHYVPSVHVNFTDGSAIKAYIESAGDAATAQLNSLGSGETFAPSMAIFSSRGPNGAAADVIKPDITAPGVQILAAATPTAMSGTSGQMFQAIAGTSMSGPHVAGIGALLKQAHPGWRPSEIKSAIMTSAYQAVTKEDRETPADPFDMGAGHINPNAAVDPGLVYRTGFRDYLGFLCDAEPDFFWLFGINPASFCASLESAGYATDASDLNLPSIGIGALAGVQTVTRTVKNVGAAGTYVVSVDAPAGIDVVVEPDTLELGTNQRASYTVAFTQVSAAPNQWAFGSLTWSDGVHSVRSPIAVRPVGTSVPYEVLGEGTEGALSFDVTFGFGGSYAAQPRGLDAATVTLDTVVDDPTNNINAALGSCNFDTLPPTGCVGITWHVVDTAPDALHNRFALYDDHTDGADDLDLYVFDDMFWVVGQSGSYTSEELVDIPMPSSPYYYVAVHGWQTDGPDSRYELHTWSVAADGGNMTVTGPAAAILGATEPVSVEWSGLEANMKYLGAVAHTDGSDLLAATLVNVVTE